MWIVRSQSAWAKRKKDDSKRKTGIKSMNLKLFFLPQNPLLIYLLVRLKSRENSMWLLM